MAPSVYKDIIKIYFDEVLGAEKFYLLDNIVHERYMPYQNVHDPKALVLDLMDHELFKIAGIDGIKRRITQFSKQFSDIKFTILDQVVEEETLMVHYKVAMKHVGTWNDIPATYHNVESYGFHLFRFRENKIYSITGMMNLTDILSQLGAAFVAEKEDIAEYLESIKRLLRL